MEFKLWSELNKEANIQLKPDLGLRSWSALSKDEKRKIWKYLEVHFFNRDNKDRDGFEFYGDYYEKEQRQKRILMSINALNNSYKARSYATSYLADPTL